MVPRCIILYDEGLFTPPQRTTYAHACTLSHTIICLISTFYVSLTILRSLVERSNHWGDVSLSLTQTRLFGANSEHKRRHSTFQRTVTHPLENLSRIPGEPLCALLYDTYKRRNLADFDYCVYRLLLFCPQRTWL